MLTKRAANTRIAIPVAQLDELVATIRQRGARPRPEIEAQYGARGWSNEYVGHVIEAGKRLGYVFEYAGRLYVRLNRGGA